MPYGDWIKAKRIHVRRDVVTFACAISAGTHGAVVPEHLSERTGPRL